MITLKERLNKTIIGGGQSLTRDITGYFYNKDVKEHLSLFQALITSTELTQEEILENFIKICGNWLKNE